MFRFIPVVLLGFVVACNSVGTTGTACTDSSSCGAGQSCTNAICSADVDMAIAVVDVDMATLPDQAMAVVPPICSSGGWCWQNPLPQGNNLRAVWANAANSVWAVGDGGTIIHFNGNGWLQQSVATLANLNGVWGASASNVYAVGNAGTVMHYDGTQWSAMANGVPNTTALRAVWGVDANNIWAVGTDAGAGAGMVYKFNSGTMMWAAQTVPGGTPGLSGVWAADATHIWAVGGGGTILFSNNGTLFAKQTNVNGIEFTAVSGYDNQHVFAVGAFNTTMNINATSNGGTTWVAQNSNIPASSGARPLLSAVWAGDATHVWASGPGGLVDFYNGTTWAVVSPAVTTSNLNGAFGTSLANVLLVGDAGTILQYNGNSYAPGNSGTTAALRGVFAADATHAWATGAAGSILAWDRAPSRNG